MSKIPVRLSIPGISKKSRIPTVGLRHLTLEYISKEYDSSVSVYTDGSVSSYASGAAFVVPAHQVIRRFRLHNKTTSTSTELVAIREAVQYISRQPPQIWTVFSDAKSALQLLRVVLKESAYRVLALQTAELYTLAQENGHHITFQWIPSHCGIQGNELADAEAKKALEERESLLSIPFSRADANCLLSSVIRKLTAKHWDNPDNRHRRLQRLDPAMNFRLPPKIQRSCASLLHRLRLGVAFTRGYVHLMRRTESPHCEVCNVTETIGHVLCDCPKYVEERERLDNDLTRLDSAPLSEDVILGPWPDAQSSFKAIQAVASM